MEVLESGHPPKNRNTAHTGCFSITPQMVATNYQLYMPQDPTAKPDYRLAVLRDRNGDLTKKWYVEFWVKDERTQKKQRKQPNVTSNTHWPDVTRLVKSFTVPQILLQSGIISHKSAMFTINDKGKEILFKYDEHSFRSQNLRKKVIKGNAIELYMYLQNKSWLETITILASLKQIPIDTQSLAAEDNNRRLKAQAMIQATNALLQSGMTINTEAADLEEKEKEKKLMNADQAIDHIYESYKPSLAMGSRPNYASTVKLFKAYMEEMEISHTPISLITTEIIYEYSDWVQTQRHNNNKSRNTKISILSTLFTQLKERGYVLDNPCENVAQLKTIKRKNFPFTPEDKKQILEELKGKDPQLYYFCLFIYYSFARIKELRMLKISDIRLDTRQIFIAPENKSQRPRYPIISNHFEKVIRSMNLDQYPSHYYVFGKNGAPSPYMHSKNTLTERHRLFLEDLSLNYNKYKLYSWKHTGNYEAAEAGVSIIALKEQNGHTDIKITYDYLKDMGVRFASQLIDNQPPIL